MEVNLPLTEGLVLTMSDRPARDGDYPTRPLQKGLLLREGAEALAEEGVGFGVPILKRGIQTVFPGGVELAVEREGGVTVVTAAFALDLVERLAGRRGPRLRPRSLYTAKNALAALHRRSPRLRGPLTATSNALRRTFGLVTTFERTERVATLVMKYAIDAGEGRVGISLEAGDAPLAGVTEVVVMNEQGARSFDAYEDAEGTSLRNGLIGTWDRVTAPRASFVSRTHRVAFSLAQADGAALHRGRELIGSRVAWAGFGYSFPPTVRTFAYDLWIERIAAGDRR